MTAEAAADPLPPATVLPRAHYQLADNLAATAGTVYLSGTQALVRLMLTQRALDAARGLDSAGFVSGYRGSPLGMVDQAMWKAAARLQAAHIRFQPAINEELAATQVLGTQRVESDPQRSVAGVFAMWYGKGPGVDRAGDAIKHGNAYGSSPNGGVLLVAGDDHGCMSSSMPHQSDGLFQAYGVPVVSPANIAELIEFGLYGWALSRFSGNWVGLAALSEIVESAGTVDLDATNARVAAWQDQDAVRAATGHRPPPDGLHYRWPDLPSLRIETRLADKLAAVAAFSAVNAIDRLVLPSPQARVGIVSCGKAHADLMEVLRRLQITPERLGQAGVRWYKVGLSFPIETSRMRAFAAGLSEILVIEEKAPVVETQMRDLFYNAAADERPVLIGKRDADGLPLISAVGELRPSRLIEIVAHWIARHFPRDESLGDHLRHVRDFTPPPLLSNAADAVKRVPYFCAGCPHNRSTKVPEGSTARAGIGCHFMANWMDRDTAGLIQMGGEGVDWVSHAMFSTVPHVFQNLGDGTYYHSGYLAIRQAVAAKARITYKILFNDAVAMTGGQPVDGPLSVDAIARQVESEGVKRVVVVSDDIAKYGAQRQRFPAGTTFHDRSELDAVQRELRELPGVTVLIYEQTCAAEKRRRRKKGELADPARRLMINERVCEGCGDCGVQSNCVAILPVETALGRKRRIDQSSCNRDYSCANGFCPSFVSVIGGRPRRKAGALLGSAGGGSGPQRNAGSAGSVASEFQRRVDALPLPPDPVWTGPYDLLVTGVGGTGVVTVGALVAMAAHLEARSASVLDFMGFAQKGGSVLSFVRIADRPDRLNQVRIDVQQADAILACDLVVGASPEALQTCRRGRTRVLANRHEAPVADLLRNPDADLKVDALLAKLRFAAGDAQVETFDAHALASAFVGDTVVANIVALGYAWQRGLVPVGLAALQQAIRLNAVAVEANLMALSLGRLAAGDAAGCQALLAGEGGREGDSARHSVEQVIADAVVLLTDYQDAAYAQRFVDVIDAVREREAALGAVGTGPESSDAASGGGAVPAGASPAAATDWPLTRTVAASLLKRMAIKDEYEVARLYTDGSFEAEVAAQFEGDFRLEYLFAPPLIARPKHGQPPRKIRFGAWIKPGLRVLAAMRRLRGTAFDVFGRTEERRIERQMLADYLVRVEELLPQIDAARLRLACDILAMPMSVRGYGHVQLASLAMSRMREAELLFRFDSGRYARPTAGAQAGQFKGISVISS